MYKWDGWIEYFTFKESSFLTALMLSLEVAPSGQFNFAPLLKYFNVDDDLICKPQKTSEKTVLILFIIVPSRYIQQSTYKPYKVRLQNKHVNKTYLTFWIMCSGICPKTLSIMAKCSKFSWVWNNVRPCKIYLIIISKNTNWNLLR